MVDLQNTEAMSEAITWDVIESAQWEADKDYKRCKRVLRQRLGSLEELKRFRRTYDKLYGALYGRISDYEQREGVSCGLGDDGFSDLLAHIMGMGREHYFRVMENPQLAVDRAKAYDFEESFAYGIPYDDDFKDPYNLDRTQKHIDKMGKTIDEEVERALNGIANAIKEDIPHNERFLSALARHMRWATDRVIRRLEWDAEKLEIQEGDDGSLD